MSHEEEEVEDTEERLTADSYGALDTSNVTEECWLIRIPQKLAQAWENLPEGTDLGELVFTKGSTGSTSTTAAASAAASAKPTAKPANNNSKPVVTIRVAEHVAESYRNASQHSQAKGSNKNASRTAAGLQTSHALPLQYSLQATTKKIPVLHPFSRNPRTGAVKLWGTVSRTANLQVEKEDENYKSTLKDRLIATSINNNRFVKPVEATESVLGKQRPTAATAAASAAQQTGRSNTFGDAVLQYGKRKLEAVETNAMAQRQQPSAAAAAAATKKARQFAPDQELRSVVFELFAQNTFWAVKDLKAAAVAGGATHAGTRKGETEIRDILREIGEYHRSGDHKTMWELRKEFQQSK